MSLSETVRAHVKMEGLSALLFWSPAKTVLLNYRCTPGSKRNAAGWKRY